MTNAQQIITTYLRSKGITSFRIISDYKIDAAGKLYSSNIYGDIMDGSTGKIIAEANIPHNICSMGCPIPTSWTER